MDQLSKEQAEDHGYHPARVLPNGKCAGILNMASGPHLVVGIDDSGVDLRYMYPTLEEAVLALESWSGEEDPPGNWIKEKPGRWQDGKVYERLNPNYKPPIPDEV